MGLAVAALAMVAGFTAAVLASRVAVGAAGHLVGRSRLPPFVVGMTLVALGTDLPEIANSVIASLEGLGDVNVGDSIGSVVTQMTLGPRADAGARRPLLVPRRQATVVGAGRPGPGDGRRPHAGRGPVPARRRAARDELGRLSFAVWRVGDAGNADRAEPADGGLARPWRSWSPVSAWSRWG